MAGVKGKCRQLYLNNNKIIKNKNKETFQARREWREIFKEIKSKDLQPKGYFTQQGYRLKLKEK